MLGLDVFISDLPFLVLYSASVQLEVEGDAQLAASWKLPLSHRQHYAVPSLPAHHSRVRLRSLFQREFLNHWTDAGHFGEPQRIFRIRRCSCRPPLDGPLAENQQHW